MRTIPVIAGVATGAALAVGGVAALDGLTGTAGAQGAGGTAPELKAANDRASAAINGYKNLNNLLGKYIAPSDQLIGAKSGPIRQDRGLGTGLPGDVIANGAITEPKLSPALQAKINGATQAQTAGTGPAGAQGPQGVQGVQGPAGAVPSTFAATQGGFVAPTLDGNITKVVDTSGTNTGNQGLGPLVLSEPKRIIANGWVDIENSLATPGTALCRPASVQTQPALITSFFGPLNGVTVPGNQTVRIAVGGARDLDANTYDLIISCQSADDGLTAEAASLGATVADQ